MKIMVIPDTQVKPGVPIDHLRWAGLYAVEKKPDVIVHIGDHWDMPSLSSYDKGKKSFEGRRVKEDIKAGRTAIELFMGPIRNEQNRLRRNKERIWCPRLVFTIGNHEQRIERAIDSQAELDGLISYEDFELEKEGWEVYDFLDIVCIGGIAFSHYFVSGVMGRPVSNAKLLLDKKHMSCVQGHHQHRDIAYGQRADGSSMTSLFVGTFYQHNEDYLGPQGNGQWRGIWMLHNVEDGSFDEMPVPLHYLRAKYENC